MKDLDIQSVAEAMHLAIKLLESGIREVNHSSYDLDYNFLLKRMEAVASELKPAMMILAPYMPHVISGSDLGEQDVAEAPDGHSVDERGYLDGTDEQSYAARHA